MWMEAAGGLGVQLFLWFQCPRTGEDNPMLRACPAEIRASRLATATYSVLSQPHGKISISYV